jgi:predicted ATP-dependent Lon-type protease
MKSKGEKLIGLEHEDIVKSFMDMVKVGVGEKKVDPDSKEFKTKFSKRGFSSMIDNMEALKEEGGDTFIIDETIRKLISASMWVTKSIYSVPDKSKEDG